MFCFSVEKLEQWVGNLEWGSGEGKEELLVVRLLVLLIEISFSSLIVFLFIISSCSGGNGG